MLARLALLVGLGWQTMLGGREVGLRRELWSFPASTHQMSLSTHSRGAWNSSLYHGHYSRVLQGARIEDYRTTSYARLSTWRAGPSDAKAEGGRRCWGA